MSFGFSKWYKKTGDKTFKKYNICFSSISHNESLPRRLFNYTFLTATQDKKNQTITQNAQQEPWGEPRGVTGLLLKFKGLLHR